jgi:hypothetical protein
MSVNIAPHNIPKMKMPREEEPVSEESCPEAAADFFTEASPKERPDNRQQKIGSETPEKGAERGTQKNFHGNLTKNSAVTEEGVSHSMPGGGAPGSRGPGRG